MTALVNPYAQIDAPNPVDRARNWGVLSTDFGMITPDSFILNSAGSPMMFKFLFVQTGGNLTIEKIDGVQKTIGPIPGGIYVPIAGYRVMSSGTTATDIIWFSGMGGFN